MIDKPYRILYHIVRQYFTKILQGRCLYTMKRLLQLALCTGLLATLLSIPSLAYDSSTREGDFSVLVNGEPVTFTDAVPQMRDSRSCLPFAAVFEALGFPADGITWDGTAKTVTVAREDTAISLTIGQPRITLTRGGETTTYDTDVAPYLADNRTYIPVGLVADVLGYRVGWDSAARAVIIDDVDAILAANTETYELMDRFLRYQQSLTEGYREFDATATFDLALFAGTSDNYFDMDETWSAEYWRLISDHNIYESDLYMSGSGSKEVHGFDIHDVLSSQDFDALIPSDFHSHTIRDVEDNILYTSFSDIYIGPDWPDGYLEEHYEELKPLITKPWYKLELDTVYGWLYGADTCAQLAALANLSPDRPFADTLEASLRTAELTSAQRTTGDILAQYNAVFADSAFTQSGSDYVSRFSTGGTEGVFTLYTSGSEATGYALELTPGQTDLTLSLRGEGEELTATLAVNLESPLAQGTDLLGYPLEGDGRLSFSLDLTLEGSYQDATMDAADFWTEPPADEPVIDLTGADDARAQVLHAALDRTPIPFPG